MSELVREGDRWTLPVSGGYVLQVCFDHAVTLRLDNKVMVRIEQPFVVTGTDGERLVNPEKDPGSLAAAVVLVPATMDSGVAYTDGRLELTLEGGTRISVPANDDYEPWEVMAPDGSRAISLPGG